MNKFDELTRRQFMANAARSYLGVSLAPLAMAGLSAPLMGQSNSTSKARAQSVIFLNMAGGMSHIDTFDPKPKKKDIQGPVKVINSAADGIQLTENLKETAKVAKHLCIINSMNSKQGAHEQGQYLMHRSYAPRGTIVHPSMGAWVNKMAGRRNKDIPGFVSIGGSPSQASGGFFGAKYAGVPLGRATDGLKNTKRAANVTEDEFHRRLALADVLNQNFHDKFPHPTISEYDDLYEEAIRLMQSEDLQAFDISKEPQALRAKYGDNHFGQGCLLARRLVEHKVRYVEVTLGGWDTHYDNFPSVAARSSVLDKAYAALLADLESRGLLDSTLVVLSTEFGRSPEIKTEHKNGRDHHPAAYSAVLAGGGVKGGMTYGKSDTKGAKVKDSAVTPAMLNATMAYALGINHKEVLTAPSGRPFTISNKATPLTKIFS